jgi:hypothetical protein
MGWFAQKKNDLEGLTYFATVVGVIASVVFSLASLRISCQAKNETERLKADAERVDIYFEAKFDHNGRIELTPAGGKHRRPVLTLYAYLTIINFNPYRPTIIEGIEPFLGDRSMPSELGIQLIDGDEEGPKKFVVSSLSVAEKKVRLSWPIDDILCEFTRSLLKKKPDLTLSDYKLELGKNPEVLKAPRKYRQLIFGLKPVPKGKDGKDFTTILALY